MSTEKPTAEQMAAAWVRYISDPDKYGSLTATVMMNLTSQDAGEREAFKNHREKPARGVMLDD